MGLDKTVAENLMRKSLDLGASMNAVAAQVEQVDVEEQKLSLRRSIANLMGMLYTDIMIPVIREYPDLDPDKVPSTELPR